MPIFIYSFHFWFFLNSTKKAVIIIEWWQIVILVIAAVLAVLLVHLILKLFWKFFRAVKNGIVEILKAAKPTSNSEVKQMSGVYDEKMINAQTISKTTMIQTNKSMQLVCDNCGATLEINTDHLIAFCPYCGHKVLIDVDRFGKILSQKEETKREAEITRREIEKTEREKQQQEYELKKKRMEIDAAERKEKRKWIGYAIYGGLGLLAFLIIAILGFLGY